MAAIPFRATQLNQGGRKGAGGCVSWHACHVGASSLAHHRLAWACSAAPLHQSPCSSPSSSTTLSPPLPPASPPQAALLALTVGEAAYVSTLDRVDRLRRAVQVGAVGWLGLGEGRGGCICLRPTYSSQFGSGRVDRGKCRHWGRREGKKGLEGRQTQGLTNVRTAGCRGN